MIAQAESVRHGYSWSKRRAAFLLALVSSMMNGGVCRAGAIPQDLLPPGWTESNLLLDGVAVSEISQTVADANRLLVLHHQNQVELVDPATGNVESLGLPAALLPHGVRMTLDGDFLLFTSEGYEMFASGHPQIFMGR